MADPREEMQQLLRLAVDAASDAQKPESSFLPFAVVLEQEGGKPQVVTVEDGEEDPDPARVLESLNSSLQQEAAAARLHAVAVVADVTVEMPDDDTECDAIRVDVEHRNDQPLTCLLPYRWTDEGELEQHADPYVEEGSGRIFGASSA